MTIVPDRKDWTWVLERPCPECGFDAATATPEWVGTLLRHAADDWQEILRRDDVRTRPDDSTWSPLEYGCHVRDVFRIFDERLQRMLAEDEPDFANWDQDATAVEDGYARQEPGRVAVELAEAAERLATRFDAVHGAQWARTGNRSDGARFTVDSFARYLVHDPVHHVWDVDR
jgi:hypothetical protein